MSLSVQVAGKTDLGCVRTNNEDNFGYDSRYGIYVVCDGMGGAAAGEVASKTSVDTVLKYFRDAAHTHRYPVIGQVRRGVITREQAERSEMQNIIIRALGSEETVTPDVDDMIALPGDILILASDGLTKHVKDEWMQGIVDEAPTLDQACADLI